MNEKINNWIEELKNVESVSIVSLSEITDLYPDIDFTKIK